MELIGSILLTLAVAVVVILFISRPFLQGQSSGAKAAGVAEQQEREHQLSSLLAERDRVLMALQELDFDHALGKVPEDEYPHQRAALLKTGADTLRRLDMMQTESAPQTTVEDRIEAAVAARRADAVKQMANEPAAVTPTAGNGHKPDAIEDLIASRKRERKESSAGFCPRCGKPAQKSDKFCSRCGATL